MHDGIQAKTRSATSSSCFNAPCPRREACTVAPTRFLSVYVQACSSLCSLMHMTCKAKRRQSLHTTSSSSSKFIFRTHTHTHTHTNAHTHTHASLPFLFSDTHQQLIVWARTRRQHLMCLVWMQGKNNANLPRHAQMP